MGATLISLILLIIFLINGNCFGLGQNVTTRVDMCEREGKRQGSRSGYGYEVPPGLVYQSQLSCQVAVFDSQRKRDSGPRVESGPSRVCVCLMI